MTRIDRPALPVVIEVGNSVWQVIEQAHLQSPVQQHVIDAIQHNMRALGIPSSPEVDLRMTSHIADGIRLLIHDRRCRQPDEQVERVISSVVGRESQSLAEVGPENLAPAAAAVCTAAIHRRPSTLLGPEQLGCYRTLLEGIDVARAELTWPPGEQRLREVLEPVLDAGVGIGDIHTVAEILAAAEIDGEPSAHITERLINRLRATTVQIKLNNEDLRWLTLQESTAEGAFAELRESLYARSGSIYPDFVFTETSELPPRTVAFGMNSLTTTPARLPDRAPLKTIAALLAEELRAHRGWFISIDVVRDRLQQIELACPDLVGAIHDRYPDEWLTAVGRALLREEVSTHGFKQILEYLLDLSVSDSSVDVVRISEYDSARPVITPLPNPRDVVSYLRQFSNEKLWESFSIKPREKVVALGTELEGVAGALKDGSACLNESAVETLVAGVRGLMAGQTSPICLATSSVPVRSVVREILEPEFPLVPVVALQELPFACSGP